MLRESRAETTEDRLDNLEELIQLAGELHTARELLDHAALATGGPDENLTGRVRLMTLHKSKGLEFPHVFLPAWEEGIFPPEYGDASEERRLAFMAITRGMRRVTISHADFRRGPARVSRFIVDIPEAYRVVGWLRGPRRASSPPVTRVHRGVAAASLLHRTGEIESENKRADHAGSISGLARPRSLRRGGHLPPDIVARETGDENSNHEMEPSLF
jgi:hypothetical protein